MNKFVIVSNGRERWHANASAPRHCHEHGYAAIVLSGGYEESGSKGRFHVCPGDVLLHRAFDAHLDRFQASGAEILNLVLPCGVIPSFDAGRIANPDTVAREAERDPDAAVIDLCRQLSETRCNLSDWPDLLAADLLKRTDCRLDQWAKEHGLAPETLSRGFGKVYGVTPAGFRAEVRARQAYDRIVRTAAPLAAIAAHTGFADQAHMTRAVRALTGAAPCYWRRRSSPFKTGTSRSGQIGP